RGYRRRHRLPMADVHHVIAGTEVELSKWRSIWREGFVVLSVGGLATLTVLLPRLLHEPARPAAVPSPLPVARIANVSAPPVARRTPRKAPARHATPRVVVAAPVAV